MPNRQKSRTHKTSPNIAGKDRNAKQLFAERDNAFYISQGIPTPWQSSKARRLANRQAAGKTFENWSRSIRASRPKANVSNLETN